MNICAQWVRLLFKRSMISDAGSKHKTVSEYQKEQVGVYFTGDSCEKCGAAIMAAGRGSSHAEWCPGCELKEKQSER